MSELKAVVVNETTGEYEYLVDVGDFVDGVGDTSVSHEVEVVAVEDHYRHRQNRNNSGGQLNRHNNNSAGNSTSTTQSITKPIAAAQVPQFQQQQQQGPQSQQQQGQGQNVLRSTPSLLRKSAIARSQHHHQQQQQQQNSNNTITLNSSTNTTTNSSSSSNNNNNQDQNTVVEFIPIHTVIEDASPTAVSSSSSTTSTSFNFDHHHGPSVLPPASAEFIRAVEAAGLVGGLKCENTQGSTEGTQLLVYNSVDNNFDVIPQDNIQLRLCQVVDEEEAQHHHAGGGGVIEDVEEGEEIVLGGSDGSHQINTIYICEEQPNFIQDSEYQNIQIVEELPMPILQDSEGNVYELEEYQGNDFTLIEGFSGNNSAYPISGKRRKKYTKEKTTKEVPARPSKRPINELKCLEPGCAFSGVNVSELRKHLSTIHFMGFDEEIIRFPSDKDFKMWREHYERERMVSFIFRGGTKKISRDQAVTYLICHRSGHYKPTMKDQSLRKRKMKPQGSCKMNGYCTAGIKLLKNLETGEVRCEICHTHYGHPLDTEAIPHLRVNNMLRKIIWTKFEQGMTFNQVVQYLHHNPDHLEGLRLLDRRAVRNIYDKYKKNPNKSFLDEDYDDDDMLSPKNFHGDTSENDETLFSGQKSCEDIKPTNLVEVHFNFQPSSSTVTSESIENTIIIQQQNLDADGNDSNSSSANIASTAATNDNNDNNNSDVNIPTFTLYDSTQPVNNLLHDPISSNVHDTDNNASVSHSHDSILISAEVHQQTVEEENQEQQQETQEEEEESQQENENESEENQPLVPIEIIESEEILPDKPIIIVNIPKKRGRPSKKLQMALQPPKLEPETELEPESEMDQDSFFITKKTSENKKDNSNSSSREPGSPVRRSTRERKRKAFYDEDEEQSNLRPSSSATNTVTISINSANTSPGKISTIGKSPNKTEPASTSTSTSLNSSSRETKKPKRKLSAEKITTTTKEVALKSKQNKTNPNDGENQEEAHDDNNDDDDDNQDKLTPPKLIKFDNVVSKKMTLKNSLATSSSTSTTVEESQIDDLEPPVLEKINEINEDGKRENAAVATNTAKKDLNGSKVELTKKRNPEQATKEAQRKKSTTIQKTTSSSNGNGESQLQSLSSTLELVQVVSTITENVKAVKKGNVVKRVNIKGKSKSSTTAQNQKLNSTSSKASNQNSCNLEDIKPLPRSSASTSSTSNSNSVTTSINIPIQDCISEEVKTAIKNLLEQGESDPTVLMYKKFGAPTPEYGPNDDEFHKEDFCLIIQTPIQRQLMQMFGDIMHLDGHKGRQKDLKLMFVMVLDEFREAIPVAWLISNTTDDRMVGIFLRVLRHHCGNLQTSYFMAPLHSNYSQIWSDIFCSPPPPPPPSKDGEELTILDAPIPPPQMILNEEDTRRDMRIEVAEAFSDPITRKVLNCLMGDMLYAVDQESLDYIYKNMEEYLIREHGDKGKEFMINFSNNWMSKTEEWSLAQRIGSPVNTLYVSESFGKLKKFIAFKGTKILSSVIDPVLKIGYDKCFSRSKRIFKGDQKLMKTMEDIEMYHNDSTQFSSNCFHSKSKAYVPRILPTSKDDDPEKFGKPIQKREVEDSEVCNGDNYAGGGQRHNIWGVVDPEKNTEFTVVDLQSPCRCKYICGKCGICVHNYICSCPVSQNEHQMCPHIHFVHTQVRIRDKKIKWIPATNFSVTSSGTTNFHLVDSESDIETILFVSEHPIH